MVDLNFTIEAFMKKLILFITLCLSLNVFADLSGPRATFKTFLKPMVKIKNAEGDIRANFEKAISTFDLSINTETLRYEIGKKYAENLVRALDKMKKVDYAAIPESLDSDKWYFDQRDYKGQELEISIIKRDNNWYFSRSTLDSLEYYLQDLSGSKVIDGVIKLETLGDKIKAELPPFFAQKHFLIETWKWLGLFILFIFAFIIEKIFDYFAHLFISRYFKIVKEHSESRLEQAIRPLGKIVFLGIILLGIPYFDFGVKLISFSQRTVYILMACATMWLGHKVIELLSFYAASRAALTETKFDDILVPLVTTTGYVISYIFGFILIASSLTIDVTSIVAGLGIGGLAFAFAAKDTLANFFGSIMLVLDRPFDIGDIIKAGDVTGEVTEVGFRSTRIRSFDDSIITISNGELMTRPIDNMGRRRFRRMKTTLGLEYDTPPEKIEAFCEGIRQLIMSYNWTRKDSFHVYFNGFGASSLDIMLVVFWKTADFSREQIERHRLMIDTLRLAKEIGVEFAFPTQTVHVFTGQKVEKVQLTKEYLDKGIEQAKRLVQTPLTLKNPRSNSEDADQFGKNDIGI